VLKSFTDLEVWKRAHSVVLEVYKLTNPFPRSEQFGVVSQIRRAAYSIPANIAEGFGRHSTKELLQFLAISNGSLEELRYFLILSRDLRYLSPLDLERLERDLKAVAQMLEALRQSLLRRLKGSSDFSRNTDQRSQPAKPLPASPVVNGFLLPLHGTQDTGHGPRNRPSTSHFSRSQRHAANLRLGQYRRHRHRAN
jgi:four helix bundle protein